MNYEPQIAIAGDGYNFTLLAGSILYHSGTGSKTSRSSRLSEFSPEAYVQIHEADADQAGIGQGDEVRFYDEALTDEEIQTLIREILHPGQEEELEEQGDLDFAHEIDTGERFRVNVYTAGQHHRRRATRPDRDPHL